MTGFRLPIISAVTFYLCASVMLMLLARVSLSEAALPHDKQPAVHISSDSAYSDGQQGIIVYKGNVKLVQGFVKILADKITVHNHRNGVSEIVAVGQPARYQQQKGSEQDNIVAKANTIKYTLAGRKILLQGNASITQDGAKITGDIIDYDIDAAVMSASGDKRIEMVIPPTDRK